jgi:hypothetical protein
MKSAVDDDEMHVEHEPLVLFRTCIDPSTYLRRYL